MFASYSPTPSGLQNAKDLRKISKYISDDDIKTDISVDYGNNFYDVNI